MNTFLSLEHPTNRVWAGAPHHPIASEESAYQEGYNRGFTWPKHWAHMPGGPYITQGLAHGCSALIDQERRAHKSWMQGWRDGFKAQCGQQGLTLPAWFK